MKQLYEEALADVKKVKEIAEADAKRAIMEAVTPRIRDFIENELLRESDFSTELDDELVVVQPSVDSTAPEAAITTPDAEGKVTLDIDALTTAPSSPPVAPPLFGADPLTDDLEVNLESLLALEPLVGATKAATEKDFELSVYRMAETVEKFNGAKNIVRSSPSYGRQIAQMISKIEDMYGYVQESIVDPAKKSLYENKLETYFKELSRLQEQTMKKNQVNEADVTLKLTGLPDEIDLESVGVDLVTGDEDAAGDAGSDDSLDGEGDVDLSDLGGDDEAGQDQDDEAQLEGLDDDTVVEIDEGMLRREIARMKRIREAAEVKCDGAGVNAASLDDFGDADDEGDALDVKLRTEADAVKDDENDLTEVDGDEMEETMDAACESVSRRLAFEKRLQERASLRAKKIKAEAARSSGKKLELLKKEYTVAAKRFNESLKRSKKLSKQLDESKTLRSESSRNGSSPGSAEATLRKKLTETNLLNAKLLYTNKLLQTESLNAKQKSQIIQQLQGARTLAEAKLVYEKLTKSFSQSSKSVNESAAHVVGSASRMTRPASTTVLNEGLEADRWAKLAGIVK